MNTHIIFLPRAFDVLDLSGKGFLSRETVMVLLMKIRCIWLPHFPPPPFVVLSTPPPRRDDCCPISRSLQCMVGNGALVYVHFGRIKHRQATYTSLNMNMRGQSWDILCTVSSKLLMATIRGHECGQAYHLRRPLNHASDLCSIYGAWHYALLVTK